MKPPIDDSEVDASPRRPLPITLICLWWFIAVPVGGVLAGIEAARVLTAPGASNQLRGQYLAAPLYLAVLGLGVVCMVGLWRMKKWGVIGLTGVFLVGQLFAYLSHAWSVGGLLAWIIALTIGLVNYRKMS